MGNDYSLVSGRELSRADSVESHGDIDLENWMGDFRHVAMPNLVIPGSHDSGAQDLDYFSTGPDCKAARGFFPLGCCFIVPWSAAQGGTAYELLSCGCRHFDLRIGINDDAEDGSEERYKLCHGYFSRHTLADFLQETREFLDDHPTEAVLLEVKSVKSFEDEVSMEEHETLIAFLEEHLGGKGAFVNRDERMRPLGELTSEGKRVFMVYCPGGWGHDTSPVDLHRDTLLAGYYLRSKWPNLCEPGPVREFLEQEVAEQASDHHEKFLVLQGVMTPDTVSVLKGVLCCMVYDRSLRSLARSLEPELQEIIRNAPQEALSHGVVLMVDWIDDHPGLVMRIIQANYDVNAPN